MLGKEGGIVISVGARQSKAKTTLECLTSAGSIRGLCGEKGKKNDAVNGDKIYTLAFGAAYNWAECLVN